MRTRSARMAPPLNGLVGSTATIPTVLPRRRNSCASLSTSVLLPLPGAPVTPITKARPVLGNRAFRRPRACGPSVAGGNDYVRAAILFEAGARSALDPHADRTIRPYVADDYPGADLTVSG